ncbi:MAG: hypothetical protein ACTS3F_01775 [Phycisphaerales bacterium]
MSGGRWGVPGQASPGWLVGFDHTLVVALDDGVMAVGRVWASSDARGRTMYPLVAMQEVDPGCGLDVVCDVAGQLDGLHERIADVRDADDVEREVVAFGERTRFARVVMGEGRGGGDGGRDGGGCDGWGSALSWRESGGGAGRVESLLADMAEAGVLVSPRTGGGGGRSGGSTTRMVAARAVSYSVRVGVRGDEDGVRVAGALALLLRDALSPGVALACVVGGGGEWVDVLVGLPSVESVWGLRAGAEEVPVRAGGVGDGGGVVRGEVERVLDRWGDGGHVSERSWDGGDGGDALVGAAGGAGRGGVGVVGHGVMHRFSGAQVVSLVVLGVSVLACGMLLAWQLMG